MEALSLDSFPPHGVQIPQHSRSIRVSSVFHRLSMMMLHHYCMRNHTEWWWCMNRDERWHIIDASSESPATKPRQDRLPSEIREPDCVCAELCPSKSYCSILKYNWHIIASFATKSSSDKLSSSERSSKTINAGVIYRNKHSRSGENTQKICQLSLRIPWRQKPRTLTFVGSSKRYHHHPKISLNCKGD